MREIGGFRYSWRLRSIPRTARMTKLWSKPKGLGQGHCARDRDYLTMQKTPSKQLALPCTPRSAGGSTLDRSPEPPPMSAAKGLARDGPARTVLKQMPHAGQSVSSVHTRASSVSSSVGVGRLCCV